MPNQIPVVVDLYLDNNYATGSTTTGIG